MKFKLPPPLAAAPPPRPFGQDFKLLLSAQLRLSWNKIRHWPIAVWITIVLFGLGLISLLTYLGLLAFGALQALDPDIARGLLSLLFMIGLAAVTFFGVTTAFATLYMSDDLELLFMAPVSTRAVFAVKSLLVAGGNFVTTALFVLVPGLFYGLLFGAGPLYYFWVFLVALGLLAGGTALSELINLAVMRLVPPHRSREAVGVIGAVAGVMIALLFQIPSLALDGPARPDLGVWLGGQEQLLRVMDYFPWGWGSLALSNAASANHLAAFGWSMLLLVPGVLFFAAAFTLVERGFRRGWISLGQGGGGPVRKTRRRHRAPSAVVPSGGAAAVAVLPAVAVHGASGSPWRGMWAVAKKDLLYVRRDTREWFGYLVPLMIMVFFVGRFLFLPGNGAGASLLSVLIMYTIMFSGAVGLQSFGREGEAGWVLNSVPLSGWPVVWGKLAAVVLPTLILMELLLVGTALAVGFSSATVLGLAAAALLITFSASAIALFFSINYCRYNPDSPQQRIASGAALGMYLLNLIGIALTIPGLLYLFPPVELTALLAGLPAVPLQWGFPETLLYLLYFLSRPLFWPAAARILAGAVITGAIWSAVFFGFMVATVRQSRKGFRVEVVTTAKKKLR